MQKLKEMVSQKNEEEIKSADSMGMKYRADFGGYKSAGEHQCTTCRKDRIQRRSQKLYGNSKRYYEQCLKTTTHRRVLRGQQRCVDFIWIEHNNKTDVLSTGKAHRGVTGHKKDGVDIAKSLEDYIFDDNVLYALEGVLKLKDRYNVRRATEPSGREHPLRAGGEECRYTGNLFLVVWQMKRWEKLLQVLLE